MSYTNVIYGHSLIDWYKKILDPSDWKEDSNFAEVIEPFASFQNSRDVNIQLIHKKVLNDVFKSLKKHVILSSRH